MAREADWRHVYLKDPNPEIPVIAVATPEIRHPAQAQEMGDELRRAMEGVRGGKAIVDLTEVEYLCSTGFAVLFGVARDAPTHGMRLVLSGLQSGVFNGALIVGLDRIVSIVPDAGEAATILSAQS